MGRQARRLRPDGRPSIVRKHAPDFDPATSRCAPASRASTSAHRAPSAPRRASSSTRSTGALEAPDGGDGAVTLVEDIVVRRLGRADEPTWRAMRAFTPRARTSHARRALAARASARSITLGLAGRPSTCSRRRIPVVRPTAAARSPITAPARSSPTRWSTCAAPGIKRASSSCGCSSRRVIDAPRVRRSRRAAAPARRASTCDGAKIAALGLRVARGCAYHGVALNVDMDLAPFRASTPAATPGSRVDADCGDLGRRDKLDARLQQRLAQVARSNSSIPTLKPASRNAARTRPPHPASRSCRSEPLRKPDWIRVRAGQRRTALLRDQADPARAEAAHRVRGSVLPEHRRVLRQRHGDLHDHGRHLHAPLPVLRRGARPAAALDAEEPRHLARRSRR